MTLRAAAGVPDARARVDVETSMWRALAVFRVLMLAQAVALLASRWEGYRHPAYAWVVMAGMVAWTAFVTVAYARRGRGGTALLVADLAVAVAAVVATPFVAERGAPGGLTLPTTWVAASVLAWAIARGPVQAAGAAAVLAVVTSVVQGASGPGAIATAVANSFLLFAAALVVGYVARLLRTSQADRVRAAEEAAAAEERERLARDIHDGVLQVLALVQRRGAEIGGEAGELARLAGDQEQALRSWVSAGLDRSPAAAVDEGSVGPGGAKAVDLRPLLRRYASAAVTVSAPATPVVLPARAASELAAAVGAALDNVRMHAGESAHAWLLVDEGDGQLVVSVRDDGPGFAAGRLEEAAAQGRLGVVHSIRGRLRDLGGEARITATPGEGTEVELVLPRQGVP